MSRESQPLVSVVTPVYNCEAYIAECIESVLAQTYPHWDYTIVNNCSTDGTLAIAERYAARDPRIRVVNNPRFLKALPNHNHALRQISPAARYCKVVFGDDWLFPRCLEDMVAVAERHPEIGIVGAYGLDGESLLWTGLPYPSEWIPGRDMCRRGLMGGPYVFGTATSLLMRADLVRKRLSFYNEENLHADHEACYALLGESDFGFVHQVLTCTRTRKDSLNSFAHRYDSLVLGNYAIFLKYGPAYLTQDEYREQHARMRRTYYRVLAANCLRFRSGDFWDYHRRTLAAFGTKINRWRLAPFVLIKLANLLIRPATAFEAVSTWWLKRRGVSANAGRA